MTDVEVLDLINYTENALLAIEGLTLADTIGAIGDYEVQQAVGVVLAALRAEIREAEHAIEQDMK